jgi:hypothetical protein
MRSSNISQWIWNFCSKKSDWKKIAAVILFQKGAITKNADDAEEASD